MNRSFWFPAVFMPVLLCMWLAFPQNAFAHKSHALHRADMYAVFGFEEDKELDAWFQLISSDLIDGYRGDPRPEFGGLNFYDYLKQKYPPFKCKHRLLFHWGFNSRPWSDDLERKVRGYKWNEGRIEAFKRELVAEQKRRNALANELTEELFGFSSGGRDAAYANALTSLVYDIHLVGDYTPDNKDMDGVDDFSSVVGDIVNSLRRLDSDRCVPLVKKISSLTRGVSAENEQAVAQRLLDLLESEVPSFLKSVDGGRLYNRMKKKGYVIR